MTTPTVKCIAGGYLPAKEPHVYRGQAKVQGYCCVVVWRCAYCQAKVFERKDGLMNVHRPLVERLSEE